MADGPDRGSWTGLSEMARAARAALRAWEEHRLVADGLHPLDDEQSFMKASPPPIPFDQSCLVALNLSSHANVRSTRIRNAWMAVLKSRLRPRLVRLRCAMRAFRRARCRRTVFWTCS